MIKTTFMTAVAAVTMAAVPSMAQDVSSFNQCQSCHVVTSPSGNNIVGRGRTGPNLYGIIGQRAGTVPDFRYGDSIVAAGASGLIWTEENLAAYISDPSGFLQEYTGDGSARSRMSYRTRNGQAEVAAFLAAAR